MSFARNTSTGDPTAPASAPAPPPRPVVAVLWGKAEEAVHDPYEYIPRLTSSSSRFAMPSVSGDAAVQAVCVAGERCVCGGGEVRRHVLERRRARGGGEGSVQGISTPRQSTQEPCYYIILCGSQLAVVFEISVVILVLLRSEVLICHTSTPPARL